MKNSKQVSSHRVLSCGPAYPTARESRFPLNHPRAHSGWQVCWKPWKISPAIFRLDTGPASVNGRREKLRELNSGNHPKRAVGGLSQHTSRDAAHEKGIAASPPSHHHRAVVPCPGFLYDGAADIIQALDHFQMNLTVLKAGFFKPLQRKGIKMIDAAFVALNENLLDFILSAPRFLSGKNR